MDQEKNKRGRPSKEEPNTKLGISMPPDMQEYCKKQPNGASKFIQTLVTAHKAMESDHELRWWIYSLIEMYAEKRAKATPEQLHEWKLLTPPPPKKRLLSEEETETRPSELLRKMREKQSTDEG